MTEAEIMKTLEAKAKAVCGICDGKLGNTVSCENCIFYAIKFALDLINRKNAEIERWKEGNTNAIKKIIRLEKEIERWKADKYLYAEDGKITLLPRTDLVQIKAEAIKEFAERLKKRNKLYCTGDEDVNEMDFVVDQIAKEMGVEL